MLVSGSCHTVPWLRLGSVVRVRVGSKLGLGLGLRVRVGVRLAVTLVGHDHPAGTPPHAEKRRWDGFARGHGFRRRLAPKVISSQVPRHSGRVIVVDTADDDFIEPHFVFFCFEPSVSACGRFLPEAAAPLPGTRVASSLGAPHRALHAPPQFLRIGARSTRAPCRPSAGLLLQRGAPSEAESRRPPGWRSCGWHPSPVVNQPWTHQNLSVLGRVLPQVGHRRRTSHSLECSRYSPIRGW
eukprot:scaffold50684_cov35-Phaeocystis_antarctica.AAC.2